MYTVYILLSQTTGKHYIGVTSNLVQRLQKHKSGATPFTRQGRPWHLVYTEDYLDKHQAYLREKKIKSYKGGEAFKKLINTNTGEFA